MKYVIENNIQFSADSYNPTNVSYDIEAFHPTDQNIIPTHLNGGIMTMICASFTKPNEIDKYKIYILN